jgi:hypothetical protein
MARNINTKSLRYMILCFKAKPDSMIFFQREFHSAPKGHKLS